MEAELVPDPNDPAQLVPSFAVYREVTMVELEDMPMPPSVNSSTRNFQAFSKDGTMKSYRGKTKEARLFEKDMAMWGLSKANAVRAARHLASQCRPGVALDVHMVFYFKHERLFCKNGKPKKLDADNRIKPLLDQLSKLIQIDDCWFFSGAYDKIATNGPERVTVCIQHEPIDKPEHAVLHVPAPFV